jgi:hypothetical protein
MPFSRGNDMLARRAVPKPVKHRGVLMSDRELVVHALRELVEALDRRVAHVERLGEARIAREAVALREEAVNRIHELTAALPDRDTREADRAGGVMTDDGGPLKKGQ